jgi:DNA adenine methylase
MPHLPVTIEEYREPFLGGGSVFLAVKSLFGKRIRRYWLNDINLDLVCFWVRVRDDVDRLIHDIHHLRDKYPIGRDLYEHLRDPDHAWSEAQRAVRFFIMNRITFSA